MSKSSILSFAHIQKHSLEGSDENIGKFMIRKRKYIFYDGITIYAIYYKSTKTIYYNLNFKGTIHIIVFKP